MRPHFTSRIWVVGAEDVVVVSGFATRRCDAPQLNLGDSLVHFELSDTCAPCLSVLRSFAQLVPAACLWRIHEKVVNLCRLLKQVLYSFLYQS